MNFVPLPYTLKTMSVDKMNINLQAYGNLHAFRKAGRFKHLIFCEVLQNEKPSVYVETNSASAIYRMEHTPEQQYGIYHFLENADREEVLKERPELRISIY